MSSLIRSCIPENFLRPFYNFFDVFDYFKASFGKRTFCGIHDRVDIPVVVNFNFKSSAFEYFGATLALYQSIFGKLKLGSKLGDLVTEECGGNDFLG